MLCPNCEAENREEAKFCDQCGFPLAKSESSDNAEDDEGVLTEPERELEEQAEPEEVGEPGTTLEPEDDDSIETDYELYQPVESERTDSFIEAATDIDRLVFGDEEIEIPIEATRETDLTGFDKRAEEYEERLISPEEKLPEQTFRDGGTVQMPRVDGDEAQKSHDYLASSTTKQKKPLRTIGIIAAVIVLAAAIGAFASYQAGMWGGKMVPDIVGMTEADASSILSDAGFVPRIEKVKSDDTEGLVLLVDPESGTRVEEGSEVVVHVAEARTIPNIIGKSQKEAESILAEEGYTNVKVKKKNSQKKEGTVIDVNPKNGTHALSSAEVTITLAQPYTVPDISNMSWDDAVAAIEKAELGYEVVYISTESYPEGTIIGTEPVAGTVVDKGSYVVIQIAQARGAELEGLASEQLAEGNTLTHNGADYIIESLDSVAYLGGNTVSYTVTAREYVTIFGTTITNDQETVSLSGTVVFNDNDEIVAIS